MAKRTQRGDATTALARIDTVKGMLTSEGARARINEVCARNIDVNELTRVAMMEIASNDKLGACTPQSLLVSVMEAGSIGLKLGSTLGHAYLVPYKNQCTMIIGYKGLIHLVLKSGYIKSIKAVVVHENDRFEWYEGTDPQIVHVPCKEDRGDVTHAYSVAVDAQGVKHFDVMTREEIDSIRKRSHARDNGPWVTDYNEMARKTVVRRHTKYLPVGGMVSEIASRDEAIELGYAAPGDGFEDSPNVIDAIPDGKGGFGFDPAAAGSGEGEETPEEPTTQPARRRKKKTTTSAPSPPANDAPPSDEEQRAIRVNEAIDRIIDVWMSNRGIDREQAMNGLCRYVKFVYKLQAPKDMSDEQVTNMEALLRTGEFNFEAYDRD